MSKQIPGLSLNKPGKIFLCGHCLDVMCEDCVSMADEFQYQNHGFKVAAFEAGEKLKVVQAENERLTRELAEYKRIATMGYNEILVKWIEDQVKAAR